jgi:hypothetical protein
MNYKKVLRLMDELDCELEMCELGYHNDMFKINVRVLRRAIKTFKKFF